MKTLLRLACVALLVGLCAFTPGTQAILAGPQVVSTMTQQGAAVDLNWQRGGYPAAGGRCATWGHLVPCYQLTSITRASVKYCSASDGMFFQVASGLPCIGSDNGYSLEEARTNSALWSRDQTQSGTWIAVGTGTALNAVGIDGTANSATTLTANGTVGSCTASCTILQTITLGSAADTYSVYLKRVTGTGTVNITINNLAGVTACTLTVAAFTRCSVTATLANPVFGIQITTVGDVIVADFNDLEGGGFATSPILTTTVSVTRNVDSVIASGSLAALWNKTVGTGVLTVSVQPLATAGSYRPLGGTPYSLITIQGATTTRDRINNVSLDATLGSGSWTTTAVKTGLAWDASGRSLVSNNGTVVTDTNTTAGQTSLSIGSDGGSNTINGYITRFTSFPVRLPDATLKALTQ